MQGRSKVIELHVFFLKFSSILKTAKFFYFQLFRFTLVLIHNNINLIRYTQLTFICSKSTKKNTRKWCEICSKLTIKTQERRHWCRSSIFIVNFEHISQFFLMFSLLTLNKLMLAGHYNYSALVHSHINFVNLRKKL